MATATPETARYETVIGLEVHSQLLTASKMFCRCLADYAHAEPNTHVCPVCLGYPGVLPVINERAIDFTIMTALALHLEIPEFSKFDRKNYGYPDLPKGYQISQYDRPLSHNGYLMIDLNGEERRIGITRIHLEEDTGRLLHRNERGESYTLVDMNRAGVPLMEIVSEPDMRSPEEARLYMEKLRQILIYLGVSSGKMEEGALRCDANVSIRPRGQRDFGTKVEIKNMNSFRSVERALAYEEERQAEVLRSGGTIHQETRGWNEERGVTISQRSKEYADDYRYFPEPDLPPLVLTRDWVERVLARMPELPDAKQKRFEQQYGLAARDAELLTIERPLADYYEAVLAAGRPADPTARARGAANWILGDLRRLLNAESLDIKASRVSPAGMAELLDLIESGKISGKQGKDVLEKAFASGEAPAAVVSREGIAQLSDAGELESIVAEVLETNPKAVEDYHAGKTASLQFLIGQVMKRTKGRAKPDMVSPILLGKLGQP
ncbi:MAG TPA: Asp-tRNA(Asn)/Glu-tRNA(Gln) amidotransferase subunit GatB [Ktedonobacterales bacterium]|nr:Asp-tRNA(Asn)/Glu-tRNA(Gln) amidotransferase subunit GatB [Ktedonobacterales bacterium]